MFKKDLLLFDIEATGIDITKHEIIQLAAVLLDRKTLKEKGSFSQYIKPRKWAKRSREAMKVNRISWEMLKTAPPMKQVLRDFTRQFGTNVMLSNYGGMLDIPYLAAAFRDAKMRYPYDYHVFDLWPVFYVYMAGQKKLTDRTRVPGFSLESIARHFKVEVEGPRHDALTDCRLEAEILRSLLKATKPGRTR